MKYSRLYPWHRKFFGNGERKEGSRYIDALLSEEIEGLDEIDPVPDFWPKIAVPEHEFADLVNNLPILKDLDIAGLAWKLIGEPVHFIVECFDIDEAIAIDTSGYDYPRYKAVIL
jgi:hypothetical protein